METIARRSFLTSLAVLAVGAGACRKTDDSAAEDAIGPLLAPSALAARIDEIRAGKIAVLYVGPDVLFGRGHVPGAKKLGPVESEEGRRALADALAKVPPESEVVVYCGCCPYRSCPNVRPASAAVRALGRTKAYVLDLPTRFATDWVEKGYPVERD